MKRSLFIILAALSLFADTTYTTQQILTYVEKPTALPDLRVKAKGRGGYGTSELLFNEPTVDLYSGIMLELDLLSSADIRKRKESRDSQRRELLALLSEIKEHFNLSWQYITQRDSYKKRLKWYEKRIKSGIESHSVVYPLEKSIMDLNAKIYHEQAEIERTQLAIATFAGDKWESLFAIVKKWDRKL